MPENEDTERGVVTFARLVTADNHIVEVEIVTDGEGEQLVRVMGRDSSVAVPLSTIDETA